MGRDFGRARRSAGSAGPELRSQARVFALKTCLYFPWAIKGDSGLVIARRASGQLKCTAEAPDMWSFELPRTPPAQYG